MRSLALVLLAAAIGVPAGAAPSAGVHSRTFSVEPSTAVQPFSIACEPGEELIGGGYTVTTTTLDVLSSYPNGGGWMVHVVNSGKTAAFLQLEVNCVAGGAGKSTVVEAKGAPPSLAVHCPEGTVVTAGGYLTTDSQQVGGAYVRGSHPIGDSSWGIEAAELGNFAAPGTPKAAAPGTPQLEVFGVCLAAAKIASADTAEAKLPRVVFNGTCAAGATLASLGYEVPDGRVQPFYVQRATSSLLVATADSTASMRLTTVCLTFEEPVTASLSWPLIGGIGLLVLLAVALAYRLRSRRAKTGAGIDVVVRSEVGGFDLDRLREVP
jgi:hypothetical protein